MKNTVVLLTSLLATGLVSAAEPAEVEALLTAPLAGVDAAQADKALQVDCLLTPSVDVQVASPVAGVIKNRRVARGDRVRKGDVLVTLRSEVEEATLALNQAQKEYGVRTIERNQDLYQQNLISEQERDEIIINNRLYSFELEQTRAQLQQKTIRSPLTGVVVETFLDPGEYVGEEPIMQVVQLDPLYVEVVLPASQYGRIRRGDVAQVTLDAPLNASHQATVTIVDRVLDAASGTFGVRLQLPNPKYRLPAGLKCSIDFGLDQQVAR